MPSMPSVDFMFQEALDQRNLNKMKSLVDDWHYELPIDKIKRIVCAGHEVEWHVFYNYNGKTSHTVLSSDFLKSVEIVNYLISELRKQKIKLLGEQ